MKPLRITSSGIFVFTFAVLLSTSTGCKEEGTSTRIATKNKSLGLKILDSSPTITEAIAINMEGAILGRREIANEKLTIFKSECFFCPASGELQSMPLLEGFTNAEAYALSDSGRVVGYFSRVMGHAEGSLRPALWDTTSGAHFALPLGETYNGGIAQDISNDGRTVVGYVTGAEPPRLQPVLWTESEGGEWKITMLEVLDGYNPFLTSGRMLISPDGSAAYGSCTVERFDDGRFDSSLFKWENSDTGWTRELIHDDQPYLMDVNSSGTLVGWTQIPEGKRPYVIGSDQIPKLIEPLEGDAGAIATGINDAGMIVGYSEDPSGVEGGTTACVLRGEQFVAIDIPDAIYSNATGINQAGQIAGMIDLVFEKDEEKEIIDERAVAYVMQLTIK